MLEYQTTIRLVPFFAILATMMVWESYAPRRKRVEKRAKRTINNLALTLLNSGLVKLLPVVSAASAAIIAEKHGLGLLNLATWPFWLEAIVVVVLFDMLIYWQHVAAHHVPVLWKLHQVHHADHDLDASSGLRFHPLEIVFSMLVKCGGAIVLGAPPEAVILFEIILNGCAVFNHSNVKLPRNVDRILRLFLVTPDMHRIHHSVERDETNSNYGFNIPWWDRVFGSYRAAPRGDHQDLKLGLPEYPFEHQTVPVWAMLMMPFRGRPHAGDNTDETTTDGSGQQERNLAA